MGTFTSILAGIGIGIGIGLATSVTAWWLTLVFLAPKLQIEELCVGEQDAEWPAYQFLVASRRRWRDLINVEVHCAFHIPHHAVKENVLKLWAISDFSRSYPPVGRER